MGYELMDLLGRSASCLRYHANGQYTGLDMASIATFATALGYHLPSLLQLFPHAERGIMDAIKDNQPHHDST